MTNIVLKCCFYYFLHFTIQGHTLKNHKGKQVAILDFSTYFTLNAPPPHQNKKESNPLATFLIFIFNSTGMVSVLFIITVLVSSQQYFYISCTNWKVFINSAESNLTDKSIIFMHRAIPTFFFWFETLLKIFIKINQLILKLSHKNQESKNHDEDNNSAIPMYEIYANVCSCTQMSVLLETYIYVHIYSVYTVLTCTCILVC